MNSAFVFVLTIIAIVMSAGVIETWIKERRKKPVVDGELEETLSRIDQLEERVRVLERIVTESLIDLKQQIDAL